MNQHHYSFGLNGILLGVDLYPKPGLPMLRIVFLGCGLTQSLNNGFAAAVVLHLSTPSSKLGSSPNEERPSNFVGEAFVATLGASLDEFAGDVRAILELTINNK